MTDRQLTLEDVARYTRPGMNAPTQVKFTPDSQKVAYLQSTADSLAQELWIYDLPSGERRQVTEMTSGNVSTIGQFSLDEELRRERSRQRGFGVTSYQFVQATEGGPLILLVPFDGRLYLARGDESPIPLSNTEGAIDPSSARMGPTSPSCAKVS